MLRVSHLLVSFLFVARSYGTDISDNNVLPAKYSYLDSLYAIKTHDFGGFRLTPICTGFISTKLHGEWQKPEAVFTWLVETANEKLLIDTGMDSTMLSGTNFPWYLRRFIKSKYRFYMRSDHLADNVLYSLGINNSAISKVLLTHAHYDHIGRLAEFSQSDIILSNKEYDRATGVLNVVNGYIPGSLPCRSKYVKLNSSAGQLSLDTNNEIMPGLYYINTREHTAGHLMFILKDKERYILLTGDDRYDTPEGTRSKMGKVVSAFIKNKHCLLLSNHDNEVLEKILAFLE